ncbi:hypothetical protein Pse7367_3631 [Thalassoporum mexicanum PCC 7367]|uniref:capsular polysaccharide export protein, LipB/KpsS family n=1 Tax=Thalassoporum mexicanum TaxID=3457544 RepID=UPI00029F8B13|nr:hypothetical protein [Pseudanabaena sp. PCC 7367]AFY71864.1 hypothetical protein Pse7367_3631 [Pseudanabaena sp. PCC 7367]
MKVLFYSPLAGSTPHFETELDLIEQHLQKGDDVILLTCDGSLPTCTLNPDHRLSGCLHCKSRGQAGIDWVGRDRFTTANIYNLTPAQEQQLESLNEISIKSLSQLKAIELEGSDIGMAALSSVISLLREPYPDVDKYQGIIKQNLLTAAIVHFAMINHLTTINPDVVVIYNGRFSPLRPALRAAQKLEINDIIVHEAAGVLDKYFTIHNNYLYDLSLRKQMVEETYANSPLSKEQKTKIAKQWFEGNRNKQDVYNFTATQQLGLLPESLTQAIATTHEQKVNIAIFNSSEDEFEAIAEWQNPFYVNQAEALDKLLTTFADCQSAQFYLRVHPNLKGVDNSQTQHINSIAPKFKNLEVIPAESSISTYALIDNCDLVISFGSSVGIEAVYAQKPSILMGRTIYEDLASVIRPKSHGQFIDILRRYIETQELPDVPHNPEDWIKYGFVFRSYGDTFKYVKRRTLFDVIMQKDGQQQAIKASWPIRALTKLSFWLKPLPY